MDVDSNSLISNNTGSSFDLLVPEVDYINNNKVNQINYINHKENDKSNMNFYEGNNEDSDIENPNEKLSNDLDEDSDNNENNEDDNEDNNVDNEENYDDNDEENEDENDSDSNEEDNNEDDSENSENENEDSNMIDEDDNLQFLEEFDKEIDNKLKLKIKIKRNQAQDKSKDLMSKGKSSSFMDNEETNKELLNSDVNREEQKGIHKKIGNIGKLSLNENNLLNKKESIKMKESSDLSSLNNHIISDITEISENQSKKNAIYEEPTSIVPAQTIVQKASVKRSSSISKNRKNKKSSIYNTKGKNIKLKKPPKKIDLMESLNKILKVIKKKDDYGVFLVPVDTNIVTDYALIIKNPMDFGTMQKKIDTKKYKSISEFQNDFELVIKNAKIYNAPETIYYRSAEKISKIGSRLIEKEIATIKNVEERRHLYFQELRRASKNNNNNNNSSNITTNNNVIEKKNDNSSIHSNTSKNNTIEKPESFQEKKKKVKRKRKESSEITMFISDGSLNSNNIKYKVNVFDQYLDKYRQICPLSEQQYHFSIAYDEFETYGSNRRENLIPHYKSLKDSNHFNVPMIDSPSISSSSTSQNQKLETNKTRLNFAYGDILGNTYVKSLERFTGNMSDSIRNFVFDYIDAITEGGHSLVKATEYLIEENSNIVENFMPPSKKIKIQKKLINSKSDRNLIVKKENDDVIMNNVNGNIPFELTPYDIERIENIINNIIIKKNYVYEKKEIGLVESIIRNNHVDFLSVIQKVKISSIIKDIILKHNKEKFDINSQDNKLVSDEVIKNYLESNIIELKLYKEMKSLKNRNKRKEATLEYNIQKRFLEMLNISSNYGIDKINKKNQLQLEKLENEILLRKKLEEENLRKQQKLEQQKLEQQKLEQQKLDQEKTKEREEAIKKHQIELEKLKQLKERELALHQQKQMKNRQEIGKQLELQFKEQHEQLLRQKLEKQKIKASQLTQFDPKKEQNKNITDQEKLLLLKQQQQQQLLLNSLKINKNKLSENHLKNGNILGQLKVNNLQKPSQVSYQQQTPVLKGQNKVTNSNITNLSYNNILSSRKNTNTLPTNLSLNDIKNLNPSQRQRFLQQQHLNYIKLQSRGQNSSTSLLGSSNLGSTTGGSFTNASSVNINNGSLKGGIANSELASLLGNQKASANTNSTNISSMLSTNQKLNIPKTPPSQNINSLISNRKNSLSEKIKNNVSSPSSNLISNINTSKTEFPASFIGSNSKLSSITKTSSYSSLLSTEQKLDTTSNVTGTQSIPKANKKNSKNNIATTNIPVTQQGPDFTSLLESNANFVSVSNLLSTNKDIKLTNSPPSILGNLRKVNNQQKQQTTQESSLVSTSSSSSMSTRLNNKSKTLPNKPDFSSFINNLSIFSSSKPNTSTISSLLMNANVSSDQTLETIMDKKPLTTQPETNFSSLLSNTIKNIDPNSSLSVTPSTPDFSSVVLSKAKTKALPSLSISPTTKPAGPDYSSLLSTTIVPSTQSLTDILGSKKVATTTNSTTNVSTASTATTLATTNTTSTTISSNSSNISNLFGDQKLINTSAISNLTNLLNTTTKLATTLPGSNFSSSIDGQKLSIVGNYNPLLGINANNPASTAKLSTEKTIQDLSLLLPNSGINVSSSTINPYILPTYPSLLPQTSLPLSLLQNQNILNTLQTPSSSQQHLTNPFLANNPSTLTNNLKSNSKKSLPTSEFPSSYFFK